MNDCIVPETQAAISLGKKLSSLRERTGLSIEDVAKKIHVRRAVIINIENDEPIADTPAVFVKGYIRSYAELVGLDKQEYAPYLDGIVCQRPISVIKNYSHKEQRKRHGKRVFVISLLLLAVIIGITVFFIWKDDQSNFVEVNHYITPSTQSINS